MRVIYFDEVKPNPAAFPDYLIAGLSLSEQSLRSTLYEFNEIKNRHLRSLGIEGDAEIHAQHIYHGKACYKGRDLEGRLQLIADMAKLLEAEDVRLVYSWIDVAKLYNASHALDQCFTHFCEHAHNTLSGSETGILIGDLDQQSRNHLWAKFASFRRNGTPWAFGQELPKFPDSVHFVDSRVCEMVQLADIYTFILSGRSGTRSGYPQTRLNELIKDINLFPCSYKVFPRS